MHQSNEAKLLVATARTYLDPSSQATINRLLQGQIEWALLIQMAHQHEITPLLYTCLRQIDSSSVPAAVMQRLQLEFEQGAQWNLYLTHELLALLKRLAEYGIAAVPYKGPILAQEIYGNLALRHFADMDLIVRRRDVARVRQLLSEEGYRPRQLLTPFQEFLQFYSKNTRGFIHMSKNVKFDLHWGVTQLRHFSFPMTEERFWSLLQSRHLGGVKVAVIPPEEMLQFLCIHGARHHWIILKWVCDVAEMIRQRPDLQWSRLITQAEDLGNLRILWLGLHLANRVLDAPLPVEVLRQMAADPMVESLSRQVQQGWFQEQERGGWEENVAVRTYLIDIKERWQDRLLRFLYFYWIVPTSNLVARLTRRLVKTMGMWRRK